MTSLRLAPSILNADFARLADEVAEVASESDLLHIDVMDGHYVPNLTLGPALVESLRKVSDLTFDAHLMVDDPETWAPRFIEVGADSVTFHPRPARDAAGLIRRIHDLGAGAAIALRPSETVEEFEHLLDEIDLLLCMTVEPGFGGQAFIDSGLDNVVRAIALREQRGLQFRVQVDGGVSLDTVARCVEAGADTLVAGSAIYAREDRAAAARAIMDAARAAQARVS